MSDLAADEGEVLDTGYLESTPEGDNALVDYARAEADAFAVLAAAAGGHVQRIDEFGVSLADLGVATPFGNTVHLTRPLAVAQAPAFARALQDFFGARPGGPYLLFSPWPTPDLQLHGFHPVGHPPLMMRPASLPAAPPHAALRIVAVQTADELAAYERTLIEAYPVPELNGCKPATMLHPDALTSRWRFFAGYEGDRCVATAAAIVTDSITIVEQVSVRDDCRGKGYGAAITAAATHAQPERTAMLIASDLGRSVYAGMGYFPLLRYTLYLGMRG